MFKAIAGEGINPDVPSDALRYKVAWNRLPALVAVDLWREYLAKFTLKELFEANRDVPLDTPKTTAPSPEETQAMFHPIIPSRNVLERALVGMLREINSFLALRADKCEFSKIDKEEVIVSTSNHKTADSVSSEKKEPKPETALQTIMRMVQARMTQEEVSILDDSGRFGPDKGTMFSTEFELIKKRGLKILSVNINNLHFNEDIEKQLVNQFNTTWLFNAKREQEQIDRKRGFVEVSGQAEAVEQYALSLSEHLIENDPYNQAPKEALKSLLLRTRDELIKNDRMHRRASMEREELEEIIQWVERNGV